jgi:uncharacterized protein YaiI (UPF0178 family)
VILLEFNPKKYLTIGKFLSRMLNVNNINKIFKVFCTTVSVSVLVPYNARAIYNAQALSTVRPWSWLRNAGTGNERNSNSGKWVLLLQVREEEKRKKYIQELEAADRALALELAAAAPRGRKTTAKQLVQKRNQVRNERDSGKLVPLFQMREEEKRKKYIQELEAADRALALELAAAAPRGRKATAKQLVQKRNQVRNERDSGKLVPLLQVREEEKRKKYIQELDKAQLDIQAREAKAKRLEEERDQAKKDLKEARRTIQAKEVALEKARRTIQAKEAVLAVFEEARRKDQECQERKQRYNQQNLESMREVNETLIQLCDELRGVCSELRIYAKNKRKNAELTSEMINKIDQVLGSFDQVKIRMKDIRTRMEDALRMLNGKEGSWDPLNKKEEEAFNEIMKTLGAIIADLRNGVNLTPKPSQPTLKKLDRALGILSQKIIE